MTPLAIGIVGMLTQGCGEKGESETMKPEPQSVIPAPTEASPFTPPTQLYRNSTGWNSGCWKIMICLWSSSASYSGGSADDAQDKLGTAELANQMLLEGAGERSSSEVSSFLYGLAVDMSVQTTRQHTILNVSAHKDRLNEALAVVSDMVFAPQFAQVIGTVTEQHLAGLQQSRQDHLGSRHTMRPISLWFGSSSGRSTQGPFDA